MAKYRFWSVIIIAAALAAGFFVRTGEPFKLGLDLSGGTHLVYQADTSEVTPDSVGEAMQSLRDTIERRVNLFGVAEPLVQIEEGGVLGNAREQRLIVELPGVTDVDEAVKRIGETPILEFRLLKRDALGSNQILPDDPKEVVNLFSPTGLTGRQLERAEVIFDRNFANQATVGLRFNTEGRELFAKITRENIGQVLGIFLDGTLLEAPYIREEITGGEAVITGDFTPEQARQVVRDLNYGALPMPINLISTETIGATLGGDALQNGVKAALVGLSLVALFMILWYRLPGFIAVCALAIYVIIMLLLFKVIPVTLTAAGIAGFIISIGMAIDANVIVFERMKERLRLGEAMPEAVRDAFRHGWTAIRDGNISTILSAVVLFWFGTSSVEGFALVLGIGTLVSMFTAMVIARIFMLAIYTK